MTTQDPNQTPNPNEALDPVLDATLTRALEHTPLPAIPADFAARVRASLPPQPAPRRAAHAGRTAALTAAVVLTIALFLIAPHATPTFTSVTFDIELLVLAQLSAITYWLTAREAANSK